MAQIAVGSTCTLVVVGLVPGVLKETMLDNGYRYFGQAILNEYPKLLGSFTELKYPVENDRSLLILCLLKENDVYFPFDLDTFYFISRHLLRS